MPGPLDGIRVFDLTRILAGPTCTQMLGDLGADVIKIERPGAGDDTRGFTPPFLKDRDGNDTEESAYFSCANRNKRSITLDLTKPKGQELARRMIAECDIFADNFKTGGLAKYGLDSDSLKDEFPSLIYCSITGFGQTGPYAKRPGYDVLIQGMSGLMSVTGDPDGDPQKSGIPISDLIAGMYAAVSINAALRHREITGDGQQIDIGMLDTSAAILSIMGANYLSTGKVPPRLGNAHPNIVPYQSFPTADGDIILAVGNDGQFERFCALAGCEELATDERFSTNAARVGNRDVLVPQLRDIIAKQTSKFWLEGLEANNVSCGPINRLDEVFDDPQIQARGMQLHMDHDATGGQGLDVVASPMRLSETPPDYRYPPPMLGQHTDEILHELLDIDDGEIAQLRADGVI
mgnify:FL=1